MSLTKINTILFALSYLVLQLSSPVNAQENYDAEIEELLSKMTLDEKIGGEPTQTLGFNRVLQRAIAHVQSCGKKEVDSGDALAAIFAEPESFAVYFLEQEGLSRLELIDYISHKLAP